MGGLTLGKDPLFKIIIFAEVYVSFNMGKGLQGRKG